MIFYSFILGIFGLNDAEVALEIYHTIIENPAEYLSYFIGYMEIMELKREAEALRIAQESGGKRPRVMEFREFLRYLGTDEKALAENSLVAHDIIKELKS